MASKTRNRDKRSRSRDFQPIRSQVALVRVALVRRGYHFRKKTQKNKKMDLGSRQNFQSRSRDFWDFRDFSKNTRDFRSGISVTHPKATSGYKFQCYKFQLIDFGLR